MPWSESITLTEVTDSFHLNLILKNQTLWKNKTESNYSKFSIISTVLFSVLFGKF